MALCVELCRCIRYISNTLHQDIHVYSIDEAFIDVTPYLSLYGCTQLKGWVRKSVQTVAKTTGIPACGLGPIWQKLLLISLQSTAPNFLVSLMKSRTSLESEP